jgi:DoxX-like family
MDTSTEPPATASRHGSLRFRSAGYWLATAAVAAELAVGGIWDIARLPFVRDLVTHLGYPSYFLVLLGIWKVLGAAALIVPRRPLLKEWAYAGAFFTYTGAIVSHLTTGYALGEVGLLAVLTALTVLSWALRPPSRRTSGRPSTAPLTAAVRDTPSVAHTIPVIRHGAAGAGSAVATPRKER